MYFSDRLKNEILQVVKQKSGCSIYIHLFPPISYLVWTCNICTKNTQLYCFSMRVEYKSHSRSPMLFSFCPILPPLTLLMFVYWFLPKRESEALDRERENARKRKFCISKETVSSWHWPKMSRSLYKGTINR